MDEEHDTSADDLRRWLGGDDAPSATSEDDESRPSRRWTPARTIVAGLVLLPWLTIGVLALAQDTAPLGEAPQIGHARPDTTRATHADVRPSPSPGPTGPATGGTGYDAVGSAPADTVPTAVRLVRDAVTHTGARTSALDSAAAEPATALTPGTWIVRVHAVVLRGNRRRWRTATHEIWVVPVGRHDGRAVGLERPWRLGTVSPDLAVADWRAADVDPAAVRSALHAAGIAVGDAIRVQQHRALPTVVRVVDGRRRVWLRTVPDLAVLGDAPAERVR